MIFELTDAGLRIAVSNEVAYGSHVQDFTRRVETALDQQREALEKRCDKFDERAAKAARFPG